MTIGFNHLGRHGRLGNQMFQYAGLRGIAAHRGFDFMIPESDFKDEWTDHQLFEAFKLKNLTNIGVCPGTYVQEAHFNFDQNLFNNMEYFIILSDNQINFNFVCRIWNRYKLQ